VYLLESVQSVQSYRKGSESRINIGVLCEPISRRNRLSTSAIGTGLKGLMGLPEIGRHDSCCFKKQTNTTRHK
jgi:hypothetical protein